MTVVRRSSAPLVLCLVFAGHGGLMCVGTISAYQCDTTIAREGTRSWARIDRTWISHDADEGNHHRLEYSDAVTDGSRLRGIVAVPKRVWQGLARGDSLERCIDRRRHTATSRWRTAGCGRSGW